MTKLIKTFAPAIMAALALAAAVPAQARPGPDHPTPERTESIRHQIAQLQERVGRNHRRDRISEREAGGLRSDIRRLRNQFQDFNRDGLSNREFRILQNRIDQIRARLRIERNDRDHHRW